jgi:hypothetical protein
MKVDELLLISQTDQDRYRILTNQYIAKINQESIGLDFYANWSFEEVPFANLEMLKEIDSFQYEMCINCNYHKQIPAKLKPRDSLPENLKLLHDELSARYLAKKETIKLKIRKGHWLWHYICEKCAPVEKIEKDNSSDLKKLVYEFLNQ